MLYLTFIYVYIPIVHVWNVGRDAEVLFNNPLSCLLRTSDLPETATSEITFPNMSSTAGAAGDPRATAVLASAGDVDDGEEYGDACEQGTSKAQQDAIQEWQSYIQRPLLVRRDGSPLHNQIQITPIQIPY